jgi:hypothetical protein
MQRQPPVFPPRTAIASQQRHALVLSPLLRHNGGCSRVCRQVMWRKIRNSVARSHIAAVHFGDNFLNCVKFKKSCNTVLRNKFALNDDG